MITWGVTFIAVTLVPIVSLVGQSAAQTQKKPSNYPRAVTADEDQLRSSRHGRRHRGYH
jgi:hypothetical protein